jgi:hypothetical protein
MKISTNQIIGIVFLVLFMGSLIVTAFNTAGPQLGIPISVAFTTLVIFGVRIFRRAKEWRAMNPQPNHLSVQFGDLVKTSELVLFVMGTTVVTVLLIVVLNVI